MVYRDIYIKKWKKLPMFLFKGVEILYYYGNIIYNDNIPNEYDKTQDLIIDCDCSYKKWKNIKRILK